MMFIDYGIVGTLLHIMFFISIARNNIKIYNKAILQPRERRFVKLLSVICIMLLINAIAESFLFSVGNIASVCFGLSLTILDLFMKQKVKEGV